MNDGLITTIARLCKDFYTVEKINELFTTSGARLIWKKTQPSFDIGSESVRMRLVYGWVEGIDQNAADKLDEIIANIAIKISANPEIPEADKSFLGSVARTSNSSLSLQGSVKKRTQNSGTKNCFIICPFGDEGSDIRNRSDLLLKLIIEPSVSEFGYKVNREDILNRPGIVTTHVIRSLRDDDLVIADLTDRNPNVFYELAIRHVSEKPCIQLLKFNEPIPFNIHGMQTITYDLTNPKKIEKTIEDIKKQLSYYEEGGEVTNPVTAALRA